MPNKCPRCNGTVYFAEEKRAAGKVWHKLCLKCKDCNKLLSSTNIRDKEGLWQNNEFDANKNVVWIGVELLPFYPLYESEFNSSTESNLVHRILQPQTPYLNPIYLANSIWYGSNTVFDVGLNYITVYDFEIFSKFNLFWLFSGCSHFFRRYFKCDISNNHVLIYWCPRPYRS